MTSAPSQGYAYGPNSDCPLNPITPLSATPSTVLTGINAMAAQGGTNITEGAAWGFRVLSPGAPFTEGNAYGATTAKVIILMTDGENTAYQMSNMNNSAFDSAYAYPYNGRNNVRLGTVTWSNTQLQNEMNARLTTVCNNAKNLGIVIYTIGVDTVNTSNPSANTALLTGCASDSSKAFFPATASDLQAAFVSIANQLAALRIEQ